MSGERPLERRMAHPPRGSSVSGGRFVLKLTAPRSDEPDPAAVPGAPLRASARRVEGWPMGAPEDNCERHPADPAVQAVYEAVAAALAEHDKATAVRTAVEAVTSGAVDIPALYRDVLSRILADTGAAWQTGQGRHLGRAPGQRHGAHHRRDRLSRGPQGQGRGPAVGAHRPAGVPTRRGARPRSAHGGRPLRHGRLDHVLPGPGHPGGGDRRRREAARRGRRGDELLDPLPQAGRAARRGRAQEGTPRHGHLGGRPSLHGRGDRVAAGGDRETLRASSAADGC